MVILLLLYYLTSTRGTAALQAVLMAVPVVLAICSFSVFRVRSDNELVQSDVFSVIFALSVLAIIPCVILYITARITTLVIALMGLRWVPVGAYKAVRWTLQIPHI